MMMPSIFGRDMFDNFFDFPYVVKTAAPDSEIMKTDIRETADDYEITMNLPGVKKENVKAELKDGYLTIQATTGSSGENKDKDGKYIRRERYYGTSSRSFYVGEDITQEDIRARFEDGTLKLTVPKKDAKPAAEQKKYITIEG